MPSMAEIQENWPEKLAALNKALGTTTMAQFGAGLKAWCDAWPAHRLMDSAIGEYNRRMNEINGRDGNGTQGQ